MKTDKLKKEIYQKQKEIEQTRKMMLHQNGAFDNKMKELMVQEQELSLLRKEFLEQNKPSKKVIFESKVEPKSAVVMRGSSKSTIDFKTEIIMKHIPTAIYHLFDIEKELFVCKISVSNLSKNQTKKVKVTSYIEGYSAKAITTVTLDEKNMFASVSQLPTLFPKAIKEITELTKATLYISVEDLDTNTKEEQTYVISLLARNSAILYSEGMEELDDLSGFLGVFITPNQPNVMKFLRKSAEHHPKKQLMGYQGNEKGDKEFHSGKKSVKLQVKAIFEALKELDCIYVNSVIDFNPETNPLGGQRVRLPRESLEERQMNCLDGTLLYASLLEACSINSALVITNSHAFLAWESWQGTGEWSYLETTMTGTDSFEEACKKGEKTAEKYLNSKAENPNKNHQFDIWSISDLRFAGVFPME